MIEKYGQIFFSFQNGPIQRESRYKSHHMEQVQKVILVSFGIWDGLFGIWDCVFVIWDGVLGNWDCVFGIWDGVFGIWDGVCKLDFSMWGMVKGLKRAFGQNESLKYPAWVHPWSTHQSTLLLAPNWKISRQSLIIFSQWKVQTCHQGHVLMSRKSWHVWYD